MKIGELFMLETVASLDSAMVVAVLQFWASEKVIKQLIKPVVCITKLKAS